MTGIERLRELSDGIDGNLETVSATRLSYGRRHKSDSGGRLRYLLSDITNQIEREERRHERGQRVSRMRVKAVLADMEHHILGHEGMEDSPVARWARELRGALKSDASDGSEAQSPSCAGAAETADVTSEAQKVTRDPAEDVSMSAYDLLPADERDAIAWVREHGGLDYVKKEWRSRVPYDRYVRRRQSLLGHIAECETALGRRREIISNLGHRVSDLTRENAELRRKAMPEGYEWPLYESGEPVRIGDDYECWCGETHAVSSVTIREGRSALNESHSHTFVVSNGPFTAHGKRVKRPSVLAADGEPLEAGQTVYNVGSSEERVVDHIEYEGGGTPNVYYADGGWDYPNLITHQRPVLDADGVPICGGECVWGINGGLYHVTSANCGEVFARHVGGPFGAEVESAGGEGLYRLRADRLTHTKPEPPDSAERIADEIDRLREEVALHLGDYLYDEDGNDSIQFSMELVAKRCRALAERERGE